jgi:hypothetical protein
MNNIDINSRVSRRSDLLESDMDGKIVMMNIETGSYYGLDGVAAEIWTFLENPSDVGAICSHLQVEYDVDKNICKEETIAFLKQMENKNIIIIK